MRPAPDMSAPHAPPLLLVDERRAAAMFGITPRTLQEWRRIGGGPAFVRISSRCVRYRVVDLEAWAAARVVTSTSAQAVAD